VTATGSGNTEDVGLVRGTDGVLHVLWTYGNAGSQKIFDTPIGPGGTVQKTITIASGLYSATDPDGTATPSGLDAFWNGYGSAPGSPAGTFEATRPVKGGKWKLAGNVPPVTPVYYSSEDSAATGGDGKPWVAWTGTGTLDVLHLGHPGKNISPSGCCVYNAGLATDGVSGATYVAYMSNIGGSRSGIYVRRLANAGGAAAAAVRLPGSEIGGNLLAPMQRTGITGRGKGKAGVYVTYLKGYPFPTAVELYKVGSKTPLTVASGGSVSHTAGSTVTAAPNGRLWITWYYGGGNTPEIYTRVSGTTGTTFSKTVHVPLPAGTQTLWKLYTSAQNGRLDVLALVTNKKDKIAYYATQVLLPKA